MFVNNQSGRSANIYMCHLHLVNICFTANDDKPFKLICMKTTL